MPIYCYRCPDCDHEADIFQKMAEDVLTVCPVCTSDQFARQPTLPHTNLQEFRKPIELFSVALDTPEEIDAFRRRNPDVKISTDPRDDLYGVPIAHSRAEKLRILDKEGFIETN